MARIQAPTGPDYSGPRFDQRISLPLALDRQGKPLNLWNAHYSISVRQPLSPSIAICRTRHPSSPITATGHWEKAWLPPCTACSQPAILRRDSSRATDRSAPWPPAPARYRSLPPSIPQSLRKASEKISNNSIHCAKSFLF